MMTRWSESGYQGHNAPTLAPARPDFEIKSAHSKLLAASHEFRSNAESLRPDLNEKHSNLESLLRAIHNRSDSASSLYSEIQISKPLEKDALLLLHALVSKWELCLDQADATNQEWTAAVGNAALWRGHLRLIDRRSSAIKEQLNGSIELDQQKEMLASWRQNLTLGIDRQIEILDDAMNGCIIKGQDLRRSVVSLIDSLGCPDPIHWSTSCESSTRFSSCHLVANSTGVM